MELVCGGCASRDIPLPPSLTTDIANMRYKYPPYPLADINHLRPSPIISGCGLLNTRFKLTNRWGKHRKAKLFFHPRIKTDA